MQENKILIRQPFNEQYKTVIEMDSKMVNSHMLSKTALRHDFTVIKCNENEIECRLVLLDIFLDQSNNDLIKEIAELTAAFNRMFSELHLKLSQKGEVLEVLNMNLILEKWEQTKQEMQTAVSSNDELKKLIAINDNLFTNPDKLKLAISANEFITLYFGRYFKEELPHKKNILGKNLFNTANVQWLYQVESHTPLHSQLKDVSIGTIAKPATTFSIGFNNAAYGQFKDKIDITLLKPLLSEASEHNIHYPTGRLIQAQINREEIAKEKELYMKIKYTMSADNTEKLDKTNKEFNKKMNFLAEEEKIDRNTKGKGFFLDENPSKR